MLPKKSISGGPIANSRIASEPLSFAIGLEFGNNPYSGRECCGVSTQTEENDF